MQQKGEALETPGQRPGEAGRASLGRAAGRPGTALLWVGGWTAHAGGPPVVSLALLPISHVPPKPPGHPPSSECLGHHLTRHPGPWGERAGAGFRSLGYCPSSSAPHGTAGHRGLGDGDSAERPPGVPTELGPTSSV